MDQIQNQPNMLIRHQLFKFIGIFRRPLQVTADSFYTEMVLLVEIESFF